MIFNPQHDLCLANGDPNFVPAVSSLKFARESKWIERYMEPVSGECITPWGWNYCLRNKLVKEGVAMSNLPSNQQLDFIVEHSRREFSIELHNFILDRIKSAAHQSSIDFSCIVPSSYRVVAHNTNEIEDFVLHKGAAVLKAPLSGSGKGIRYINGALSVNDLGWINNILYKQRAVVVEQKKEVLKECAMLFKCDKQSVTFKGYSLFYTCKGAYVANVLSGDEYIKEQLSFYVPTDVLEYVQRCIYDFLQQKLYGKYIGYIGVDQMCCRDGFVPASEINMRMTMGHIAANVYAMHKQEYALGEGTHTFSPFKGIERL